jgi:cephalosporin hydroxylase
VLEFEVPQSALTRLPAEVEYEVDKTTKDPANGHELGLIVVGINLRHSEALVLDRESATQRARQGYLQMIKRRQVEMPIDKQNDFMKLFHDLPVWRTMWFQNVQIAKNPLDLWMMQQIIYETQPDFIVETGTYKGGSALYWAYTLNGMGLGSARVFTIDIQDLKSTAENHWLWKKYITFLKGSSTDRTIVSQIAEQVKGRKVLVTLDSDHSMQHVLNELYAYAPMVSKGGYLVVEDTHIDGVPSEPNFGPGPMAAVVKFLQEGGSKDYEQDLAREALLMTFNPGGWLRRK